MKSNKEFFWSFLFLIPSLLVPSGQGTFQKSMYRKTLKISLKTHTFLKNIQTMQYEFLFQSEKCQSVDQSYRKICEEMMNLNREFCEQGEINPSHVKRLFDLIGRIDILLGVSDCSVDYSCKIKALQKLWQYLKVSLQSLTMMGYESDRVWLEGQITHIDHSMQNQSCINKLILTRLIKVCMNVIHQVDGVMVTEFDLLVLTNLMLAFVLLRC